jgi:predicted dehydrogenase
MENPRIAVVGAGLIGRRHAALVSQHPAADLVAIVDPAPAGRDFAQQIAVAHHPDLDALLTQGAVDGVILATPTQLHFSQAMQCIAAGMPVLVEKPVCVTLAEAKALATAAEGANVAVLVGHHRRHNPLIAKARAVVQAGLLGRIVAVQASVLLRKPEDYFASDWRRREGAGPLMTNLIHDVDFLRHILGEIKAVQAMVSHATRGFAIEDSAAVTLRFASGALGTIAISDVAAGPWSWELTAAENPDYPATGQSCTLISGTDGALELPSLRHWHFGGAPKSWYSDLQAELLPYTPENPLDRQISHFADVIAGRALPLISVADAAASLAVVEAIQRAARTGQCEDLNLGSFS